MDGSVTIPELTEVVARVSALLGPREGAVLQLEGGITNRNFRVSFGGTDYVVRLPGKRTELLGIDREAECVATKAAAQLGFAPRVAALLDEPECLITAYVHGRAMGAEELRRPGTLAEVAHDLRALHGSGTELPNEFDPFRLVEDYAAAARARGAEPPGPYEDALRAARSVEAAVEGRPGHEPVPCHNDLLPANFFYDGRRVQLIDWEYAGMGDRWFDLGNLAANVELDGDGERRLLEAYLGEPADDAALATLGLFRFVSDFREAMWGTLQSVLSDVEFDFAAYARRHFERVERELAGPRLRSWIETLR